MIGSDFDYQRVRDFMEQRMRALGLTNSELARRARVDRSQIARLLSGEPWSMRPSTLGKVETALDLPAGTIEGVGMAQILVEPTASVLGAIEADPTLSPRDRKLVSTLYLMLSSGVES